MRGIQFLMYKGVEAVEFEALGVVFALADLHLAASAFFYLHLDGCHHGLTGIFVSTRLTVIEHIPLAVDLAD